MPNKQMNDGEHPENLSVLFQVSIRINTLQVSIRYKYQYVTCINTYQYVTSINTYQYVTSINTYQYEIIRPFLAVEVQFKGSKLVLKQGHGSLLYVFMVCI